MKDNRILGLDIIRTFAIISVLIIHTTDLATKNVNHYLQFVKFDGVLYFFVLSGFLIGSILIKSFEKSFRFIDIWNFWIRRWFRTLPNYLLFLILLMILQGEYKLRIFKYIFFAQNFYKPISDFFPESWSLTIEEWFYMALPIMLFILHRVLKIKFKTAVLVIVLSVILITPLIRYYLCINYNVTNQLSWNCFIRGIAICRFDSIIFGVLGAYIWHYYPLIWLQYKKKLLILGVLAILGFRYLEINWQHLFFDDRPAIFMSVYYLSIQSFLVLLLLPYLSDFKTHRENLLISSIRNISLSSYSIYLVNYSLVKGIVLVYIQNLLVTLVNDDLLELILISMFWILSIGSSILLYKHFELPFMNLRDLYSHSKTNI